MKSRFDIGVVAFFLLTMSMATVSHASDVPRKPLRFVDEDSVEIESYCVAPVYSKSSGFAWGGKGMEWDGNGYLMWPVLVREGDGGYYHKLKRKEPSMQILGGWIAAGESIVVSATLFLKADRVPFLNNSYTDPDQTKTVVFRSGNSNAAIDLLTSDNVDQEAIRDLYKLPKWWKFVNSYTKEDKELLRTCYKK